MPSEMVERVAQAMGTYTVKTDSPGPIYTYGIYEQPYEFKKPITGGMLLLEAMKLCAEMNARAAIEAMREPTRKMEDAAGHPAISHVHGPYVGSGRYKAMIDAALE